MDDVIKNWKQAERTRNLSLLALESEPFQPFLKIQSEVCLDSTQILKTTLYLNIQTSNWVHGRLRVCTDWCPVFSNPNQLGSPSAAWHSPYFPPTPCSPPTAFKIAWGPTGKDRYSNLGSSFYLNGRGSAEPGRKIQRGEPWGVPTLKPS